MVNSISFQTFLVQAFKIAVDSWKFTMLLLYILWHDWAGFMISRSNEHLQQELEYTLLKPDCHSWRISKMQSRREHFTRTICNKIQCINLGKMLQRRMEFFRLFLEHLAWIEWHKRFKEGRESMRDDEKCERSKEVNTPELINQTVRVRVTMLRF